MKYGALYPRPRRNRWLRRFILGLVLLSAALVGWLRWKPPEKDTPQTLLPVQRRSGTGPATGGRTPTNPAPPLALRPPARTNSAAPRPFVPNPNLIERGTAALDWPPRSAQTVLEAQIALARLGLSPGSIDGSVGRRTRNALRVFQARNGLRMTGQLDAATRARLVLQEPPYTHYTVTAEDLARLLPVGAGWLEKSRQPRLDFETLEELVGEKCETDPAFIRQLNQDTGWANLGVGTRLLVPNIRPPVVAEGAAFARIRLADCTLQAFDEATNVLAHFPCSIGRNAEKRPVGLLHVAVIIPAPNYTYNPENFPASALATGLTNKLLIPPGPNNPVGTVWIGLDRAGYGIHGTPHPDRVGVPESLGCFRLANWNAEHFARLAWPGLPVYVEP